MEEHKSTTEISKNDRLLYSQDILEKKFGLYQWTGTLNGVMMTINSILSGFSYIIFDKIHNKSFELGVWLVIIASLLLCTSISIGLFISIPRLKSKLWNNKDHNLIEKNPRTVLGIIKFKGNEYANHLKELTFDQMIEYNADEILKVNRNIFSDHVAMKCSAWFSFFGLVFLFFTFMTLAIQSLLN